MLRDQGRDLHAEFVRLLPAPPRPIRIQRWSVRRVGLWAAVVLLAGGGRPQRRCRVRRLVGGRLATRRPLHIDSLGCDADLEPLWLQAQSVPSATLVPCVRSLPAGWTVANVAVNDGRSVITLNHDRAGTGAGRGAADRRLRPDRGGRGAIGGSRRAALPADRERAPARSPPSGTTSSRVAA